MNKLIISLTLGFVIIIAVFVSAATMVKIGGPYEVTLQLEQGWDIISGTIPIDGILSDSEVKIGDISAMWYYSPIQKKYIQIHPITDWDAINKDDEDFVLTNAFWIFSKKSGTIKYTTLEDYPPLENRQLYAGWNFLSMSPDLIESVEYPDLTFEDIIGNCKVENTYYFFDGNWLVFDFPEMDSTLLGKGLVVKVTDDCNLGYKEEGLPPPSLPT